MKIVEDRFYRRDKHEYELQNNEGFKKWLIISADSGTKCNHYIKLEDMQGLIEHLNNFYHIKYPDFVLKEIPNNPWGEMIREVGDTDIQLSVPEMILRLPWKEMELVLCEYGVDGNTSGNYSEYENGRLVNKSWVGLRLKDVRDKRSDYSICFDPRTGMIIDSKIESFIGHDLETVLQYLETHPNYLDFKELKKVVNTNHFEIELRHRLLQLTALKILYTSSNPEVGYERAKRFINEMNEELGLLLSTKEIDRIYQKYEFDNDIFRKTSMPVAKPEKRVPPKGPKVLKMKKEERINTD